MIKYIFWDFNGTILDDRELSLILLNDGAILRGVWISYPRLLP
jgi:hypothetical protein